MRNLIIAALVAFSPCNASAAQDASIAFEHVRIRTMQAGRVIADGHVIVRDGGILAVGEGNAPDGFIGQRIDGAGATLMPGLADMHVHHYEPDLGAAYLANGITLVRNLTGALRSARIDQAALDGTLVGPRVESSGPIIDGEGGFRNPFFIQVGSPEQAVGAVRSQARSGYEAVKLYEQLDAETYRAAVAEARANKLRVYGHVPSSMDILAVLALKIDSIEHLDGYAQAMARPGFSAQGHAAWAERWANVDRGKFAQLVTATVESGTWSVPTFALTYGLLNAADPDAYFARPEAELLPLWADGWRRTVLGSDAERRTVERSLVEKVAFVAALKAAGAPILIGTDAPNPYVTPGYSIHDELEAFKLAGFSNEEILFTATVEAARFLGDEGVSGVIAPGARADIILLPGDPVDDLSVLRRPLGAMVAGHWHSRESINLALEQRRRTMTELREE